MAFTIPDKGEGDNDIQSIFFQEYLDVLVAGLQGIDCVLSGLAITGGADMTPAVAKGSVLSNRVMFAVAAADVTVTAADATNPRIDLIVVNSSGALAVRAGTAAAAPKPPARTANDVVIASVYVPASDTTIGTSQITDLRVFPKFPVCIFRMTTAETTNTTASAIHILDKTNSGVSIPDGMFTAGRVLRLRIGGNTLVGNNTPTITIIISIGGSSFFQDISAQGTADATNRVPWYLDMDIISHGDADQDCTGTFSLGAFNATRNPPTTGIGDIWLTSAYPTPFRGAQTVNTNTANRTLAVTWTFTVSHADNEVVTEFATLELL